jgi:hypothetical protein
MSINIYQTPQGKNRKVCAAFAAGCGGKIVPPYPLLPGEVFMFGYLRGVLPTLQQAQREGRTFYFADNGYFRPGRRISDRGFYRITRNALHHDGSGDASSARWKALKMTPIAPWRKAGSHVVVCPPSRLMAGILNFDADKWLADVLAKLEAATDRPIRLRRKMSWQEVMDRSGPTLADDLRGAWTLVTHSSNAAVEALLLGVPAICTRACAAHRMTVHDPAQIETPIMPDDREQWAWNLAANQWNLAELADGTCWRDLQRQHLAATR